MIYYDFSGMTALMAACRLGEEKCVKSLLFSWRLDIDKTDNSGNTALILTAFHLSGPKHLACLEMLLEQDAEVNVKNNVGMSAMMYCPKDSAVGWEAVKMLLSAGSDPYAVNGVNENLLMQAAAQGYDEMMQRFLDMGVDDAKCLNFVGDNALILALKSGHAKCVSKLLQAGYDPNSVSGHGCHTLNIAAAFSFDLTLQLLTYGALLHPSKLFVSEEFIANYAGIDNDLRTSVSQCSLLFQPSDVAILHRNFSTANLLATVSSSIPVYKVYPRSSRSNRIILDEMSMAAQSCPQWLEVSGTMECGPCTLQFMCQQVVSSMAGFSINRRDTLNSYGLPPRLVRFILFEGLEEEMFLLT